MNEEKGEEKCNPLAIVILASRVGKKKGAQNLPHLLGLMWVLASAQYFTPSWWLHPVMLGVETQRD